MVNRLSDGDLNLLEVEIEKIYQATSPIARERLFDVVRLKRKALVKQFYDVMMTYPQADLFLANDLVHDRLNAEMEKWLMELFSASSKSGEGICRRQLEVGAVHARIKVPISMVMRGFREIKRAIMLDLVEARNTPADLAMAANLLTALLDVALAMMTTAYFRFTERVTRTDEALRLYSMAQDLAAERERQRAALLDWAHHLFFEVQLPGRGNSLVSLGESDFGLWFAHRAQVIFGQTDEYETIVDSIARCDDAVDKVNSEVQMDRVPAIRAIKAEVDKINALLAIIFESAIGINSARDPLTKLLSRQFLLPAVSREIGLTQAGKPAFSLVTFLLSTAQARRNDINQQGWDEVLLRSAQIIISASRSSDSAFRLGDKTFLVLRVESGLEAARQFADEVANRLRSTHLNIEGNSFHGLDVTYSITEHDGHPDPRHIIKLAEQNSRMAGI